MHVLLLHVSDCNKEKWIPASIIVNPCKKLDIRTLNLIVLQLQEMDMHFCFTQQSLWNGIFIKIIMCGLSTVVTVLFCHNCLLFLSLSWSSCHYHCHYQYQYRYHYIHYYQYILFQYMLLSLFCTFTWILVLQKMLLFLLHNGFVFLYLFICLVLLTKCFVSFWRKLKQLNKPYGLL